MDVINLSNDLNTKLNLIKSSVKDIQSSIKAKGIDVNNDIRTYAEAINKISGGSSQTSNIKLFSTEEEMRSSTGNNKDDLAVVYGMNWLDIQPNDSVSTYKLMFPLNITLPYAMGQEGEEINYYMNSVDYAYTYTYIMTSELNTDNTEVVILTVKFQCPELNIDDTIVYKSTDSDFRTFKLYNHDTDYIIDLSAHGIIFQYYNDYSSYVTKYCKYIFNGIYQYKKDQSASDNTYTWQYAETQLTTNLDGPSLDEKFYTNNGVGTANVNMYTNMSSYYLLNNLLNLTPKYAISRALQGQLQYFDYKSRYYAPLGNDVDRSQQYILKNVDTNSDKIQQIFMKSLNHKDISDFIKIQPGNYSSFYITKIKDGNYDENAENSTVDHYLVAYTDTTQNKIEFKDVYGSQLDPSVFELCDDIDSISNVDTSFGLKQMYITSSNNIYFIYKSDTSPYTYRLALFTYDIDSNTHNIITISDTDDLVDSDTQTIDPDSFSIKVQESDTTDLITYYYRVNKTDTNEFVHHYSIKIYNKTNKTVNEVATDLYSDIEYSNLPSSIMMINGNTAYIVSTLHSDDGAKMHNRIHNYDIGSDMCTLEKSVSVDIGNVYSVYSQYANDSTIVKDNIIFDYTSGYLVDLNTGKIYQPSITINGNMNGIESCKGFTLIGGSDLYKIDKTSIVINENNNEYTISMSSLSIIKYANCNFTYIYNYISDSGTGIDAFAENLSSGDTQYELDSNNHTIVRGRFYEELEPVYLASTYDQAQDEVEGPYFATCGSYGYNQFGKLQSAGNVEFMLPLF